MLALDTEFPQVGSTGWLKPNCDRPDTEEVRILQRCRDGTRLIKRLGARYRHEACTANLRVDLDQLAPTREEALPPGPVRRSYRRRTRA